MQDIIYNLKLTFLVKNMTLNSTKSQFDRKQHGKRIFIHELILQAVQHDVPPASEQKGQIIQTKINSIVIIE